MGDFMRPVNPSGNIPQPTPSKRGLSRELESMKLTTNIAAGEVIANIPNTMARGQTSLFERATRAPRDKSAGKADRAAKNLFLKLPPIKSIKKH